MATTRSVLGILCLACIGRCNYPVGSFVTDLEEKYLQLGIARSLPRGQQNFLDGNYAKNQARNEASLHKPKAWPAVPSHPSLLAAVGCRLSWCNWRRNKVQGDKGQEYARANIIAIALSQVGVREQTGQNDGEVVTAYLGYVNLKKGSPWCAAFVSWVFGKAGFASPKTGWSPALFPLAKQTLNVQPATVFGIYFPMQKRIAHVGLVQKVSGSYIITVEGNTSTKGSREGDGVYSKRRHLKTIKVYADWIGK
jgi:hypothetical protein